MMLYDKNWSSYQKNAYRKYQIIEIIYDPLSCSINHNKKTLKLILEICSTVSYLNYNDIIIQILIWLILLTELLRSPHHRFMILGHGKSKAWLRATRIFSWDDACIYYRMWFFLQILIVLVMWVSVSDSR